MTADKRPNLLFIIADDLGYSDIGCYGGEIQTPNIDALSRDGVRMLNYHTAAACSPTRAMLLTGTDAHLGGLGALIEFKAKHLGGDRINGKPGYEGYLNNDVAPLPEVLEDNGYYTALSGKWHLGMRKDGGPWARGFQKSFAMLPGCCNHYGWEPMLEDGHSGMRLGGRPIHAEDGVHFKVPANKDESGFYSSDDYADRMIRYLAKRSEEEKEKPFFGYLAYTAPHWPIQCDKKYQDKYRNMYDDGPYALREKRLQRLKEMGIIRQDVVAHEVVHGEYSEWDDFTDYERACSVRVMETYAGMVEQMDASIGRVVQSLKDSGEYENTMIVFMSDNGAEGAAYEAKPVLGDYIKKAIHAHFDNSLDNIGRWNSFTWVGPLWAQASTAPSRLYKGFSSQGGILVPCVVKLPAGSHSNPDWIPGSFNRSFSTCMDLYPTFLDMINVQLPQRGKKQIHRNRDTHLVRGKSWLPFLKSDKKLSADDESFAFWREDESVGWELHEQAALRKGHYKVVYIKQESGGKAKGADDPNGWELFNLQKDPGEVKDISQEEPEVFKELTGLWEEYVQQVGLVWGPNAKNPGLSEEEAPHLHEKDVELQRTWLQAPHGSRPVI